MNNTARPETTYLRRLEQSHVVPVVMLALLHARQLEDGSPYVKAAEILTDWAAIAADLNRWWGSAEQLEARVEAQHFIERFAHLVPPESPIPSGRDLAHLERGGKVLAMITPHSGDAA